MAGTLKRVCSLVVYLAAAGVVILAVCEVAVRISKLAPPLTEQYMLNKMRAPDPVLPYKLRPSIAFTGRSDTDEFDFQRVHNAFGFRDEERSYEKPAGVFRVLGLGDSFTYGIGARYEEGYLRRVEKALNARPGEHPQVQVIKAGIPGYFPEPERMLLQHYGVRYQPDVIIVCFVDNDIIDTYLGLEAIGVDESGYLKSSEARVIGPVGTFFYIHSNLARAILSRYIRQKITENYRIVQDEVYKPNGLYEAQWRQIEKEYRAMAEMARSIDAKLVLLYIPAHDVAARTAAEQAYPPQRLSAWAKRNGVTFVNTTPAILAAIESSPTPLYHPRDSRCTSAGYATVANELYRVLTENSLVP